MTANDSCESSEKNADSVNAINRARICDRRGRRRESDLDVADPGNGASRSGK